MFDVLDYLDPEGKDPYIEWLAVQDGVLELRIDWGPGYRVYYVQAGRRLVLLLAGGDKRKQQSDIAEAVGRWHDWQHRRKSP